MKDEWKKEIRFADLFAGAGGFRLGIERAGVQAKCVFSNECDKWCRAVYNQNFKEHWKPIDIRSVSSGDIPSFDLLCAGFPCQPFSLAGKRLGLQDSQGGMFFEIIRILKAKKPSYLLLENVKGLLSHNQGQTFALMLQALAKLGYDIQWMVLNSQFFAVPQHRERVFIVGSIRRLSRPQILPFPSIPGQTTAPCRKPAQVSGAIRAGYAKQDNSSSYVRQLLVRGRQGSTVYSTTGPSLALLGNNGGWGAATGLYAVPGASPNSTLLNSNSRRMRVRKLTPRECERLQGFPQDWTWKGVDTLGKRIKISDTQRYKMMGNAVTVNVIEALVRQWFGAHRGHKSVQSF